jgi:hypothetical protein
LPGLDLNCYPSNLCFLSSWNYRCEPPHLQSVVLVFLCVFSVPSPGEYPFLPFSPLWLIVFTLLLQASQPDRHHCPGTIFTNS